MYASFQGRHPFTLTSFVFLFHSPVSSALLNVYPFVFSFLRSAHLRYVGWTVPLISLMFIIFDVMLKLMQAFVYT